MANSEVVDAYICKLSKHMLFGKGPESGAGLSLFIILPREGSIDNGKFGTDDGINGINSQ